MRIAHVCISPLATAMTDVDGAAVSIVHRARAEDPGLPAASVARTSMVCMPFMRPVIAAGAEHAAKVPPSRLHAYVQLASLHANAMFAFVAVVSQAGAPV